MSQLELKKGSEFVPLKAREIPFFFRGLLLLTITNMPDELPILEY
jgi:hypothetical protein